MRCWPIWPGSPGICCGSSARASWVLPSAPRPRCWAIFSATACSSEGFRCKGGQLRIAYLVNRYPATSHSFIRREIHALEAQGLEVLRFSIQPLREQLVNEADRLERGRTRVVLGAGAAGHALSVLACAVRRPAAALRAVILAIRLGWRSDRGLLRHLAYLAESCVLTRWLQRAGADHVHAHFGTNPAMVAMLCR